MQNTVWFYVKNEFCRGELFENRYEMNWDSKKIMDLMSMLKKQYDFV